MAHLPKDPKARKQIPLAAGFFDYFPDAIVAIANLSFIGNEQHNPGQPLHWSREKSNDHADCALRHFLERGTFDTDNVRHTAKAAWRIMALLQLEIEAEIDSQNRIKENEEFVNACYPPNTAPYGVGDAHPNSGLHDPAGWPNYGLIADWHGEDL